jgi:cytochrome b561
MTLVESMADAGPAAPLSAEAEAPILRNEESFSRVAILLHWIIAFFIFGQIGLGWSLGGLPPSPARGAMIQLHKSIGITILLLSFARLGWRLANSPPPPPSPEYSMPRWQHLAAAAVHWGFYVIMIGLPLTGWIMVSASNVASPIVLYGLVPWPAVPGLADLDPASKAMWHAFGQNGHGILALSAIVLIALHLGAAAKHQLLDRDTVLARMAPGARPGWKEQRLWLAFACALIVAAVGFNFVSISRAGSHGPAGQAPQSNAQVTHGAG